MPQGESNPPLAAPSVPVAAEPYAAALEGQPDPAPPAPRRRPRWWVIALIVVGVLAAVAAVGFQGAKFKADDIWRTTTFAFPAGFDGTPRRDIDFTKQWADHAQAVMNRTYPSKNYTVSATSYGYSDESSMLVMVVRPDSALDTAQRVQMQHGLTRAITGNGGALQNQEPGPLGGTMSCGTLSGHTFCFASDPAGQMIIEMPSVAGFEATARRVRELVETRH